MAFPTDLDSFTDNVDDVMAAHVNTLQAKVGVDASAVTSSHDYKIRKNLPANYLKNGNFINNSTNGYGGTPDDWTSSSANPVQGGIPELTKAQLISILGVGDGDIEGLWPLNEASGSALDLSSNGYDLTDTNTVLSSDDGLLAKARNFELDTAEHFTVAEAGCANLEIASDQTWFCWVKPEEMPVTTMCLMTKRLLGGVLKGMRVLNNGKIRFDMTGLTTNQLVDSSVAMEAGRWYFVCGVYDSTETKLKIWVNGVKAEVTASGGATDGNGNFYLGCREKAGPATEQYYDGLMQNAGVLSVALSDDEVKRLWAYTSYKGQKVRRDGTDGLLYQDLPQDLVERLRGRTITLRAKVYASNTNHRVYIDDGVSLADVNPSGANAWEEISVTRTIDADAVQIRIGLEADTSDGNMWIKEVALYEGSTLLPYDHSKEDWDRFPRLLKLDPPATPDGYQFEENRWFDWTPTIVWTAGTDPAGTPTKSEKFMIKGNTCTVSVWNYGYTPGVTVTAAIIPLPIAQVGGYNNCYGVIWVGATPNLSIANVDGSTNDKINIYCTSASAERIAVLAVYPI